VRDFLDAGYLRNANVPLNEDVGLLFLDSCLSATRWTMGRMSTPQRALDDEYGSVRLVGWGENEAKSLWIRKSFENMIQPHAVCTEWYLQKKNSKLVASQEISPERHLCHSGESSSSTCFGDSGGPVIATDPLSGREIIVGVTSFGMTENCGEGPSYVSRLSTYASWIDATVDAESRCSYNKASMFATYPLA
jgi:hypothetical protein